MNSQEMASIFSMRTNALVISLALPLGLGSPASANQSAELVWIVETMVRLCVIGGDQFSISSSSAVAGEVTLQSLSSDGSVEGEFQVERNQVEGLINGIDNSMSNLAAQQASEARACLAPIRSYIMSVYLGDSSEQPLSTEEQNLAPTAPVSTVRSNRSMQYDPGGINENPNGFNCSRSAMTMDYVICSFQEVYDVNTQHAIAWWNTLDRLSRAQKDTLIADQRAWIDRMLQACQLPISGRPTRSQAINSAECVRDFYIQRTAYVRNY